LDSRSRRFARAVLGSLRRGGFLLGGGGGFGGFGGSNLCLRG
jgi:hypothetical protein